MTQRVTAAVVLYLFKLGFKPVAAEVGLEGGWCADVAGVITPTPTEAINLKLLGKRPRYATPDSSEATRRRYAEWEAAYQALPSPITALVEVKTTRGDFLQDRKWGRTPPTNLCFLAVPKGLIHPEEYPEGWGILECDDVGRPRLARRGRFFHVPLARQLENVLSIAVRLHNATHYAEKNRARKRLRIEDGERKARQTAHKAMSAMIQIVRGELGSVDVVLATHRMADAAKHLRGDLESLWGAASGGRK